MSTEQMNPTGKAFQDSGVTLCGLTLLLWLARFMNDDFNPMTDFALADVDVEPPQIDEAFKRNPWVKRLFVNHKAITRAEWKAQNNKTKEYKIT